MRTLVLASASPRRRELLQSLGVPFAVIEPNVAEELVAGLNPPELAGTLAARKLAAVLPLAGDSLVIAADTIVVTGTGVVLGKPRELAEGRRMLGMLQGAWHTVFTGVTVGDGSRSVKAVESTRVHMRPLSQAEIDAYLGTSEPWDKAGGYAIQGLGSLLVDQIEGCYFNVVGLPMVALSRLLGFFGVELLEEAAARAP